VAEPRMSKAAFAAGVAGVALLAAVSVAPSVGGGLLHFGDRARVTSNPRTESLPAIFSTRGEGNVVPLGDASYAVDRSLFGGSAAWMRWHGVLSAALFAALAALVAAKMTGSRAAGLVAGALFAVHPLTVEPGAWIAARTVNSAGIWLALSGLVCLPGADGPESHSPGRIIGATFLFAAACLTHPVALAYPLMLLVLAAFPLREDARGTSFAMRARPLAAMLLPALAFGAMHALTSPPAQASRDLDLPGGGAAYVLRCFAATGRTLMGVVIPARLGPDYSSGLTTSGAFGVVSMLTALALAGLSWRLRRSVPALAVFTGWTLATVFPAAALTAGFGADSYAVFAVLGGAVFATDLLRMLWSRASSGGRLVTGAAVVAAALAMLVSSLILSSSWRDEKALWTRVTAMRPDSPGAHLNLGRFYSRTASSEKTDEELRRDAKDETVKASNLGASETASRLLLGRIYYRWGFYGEASEHFMAIVNMTKKMDAAARRRFLTADMLAEVHVALGNIFEKAYAPYEASRGPGRRSGSPSDELPSGADTLHLAKANYEQALEYCPERPDALLGHGRTLNRLGKFEEATGLLERAVRLDPRSAATHWELGHALESTLKYQAAEEHYLRAAELDELDRRYATSVQGVKSAIGSARRYEGEEAEQVRDEALALYNKGLGHEARGAALSGRGLRAEARAEFIEAYRDFKGAASRRLDFAAAHQRAGACAFRLGWFEQAKVHLDAADLYRPGNLATVYFLAGVELELGRLAAAEHNLLRCVEIDRRFGQGYLGLAWIVACLRDKPDYEDALIHVNSAVRLGTPRAERLRDYILKLKSGEVEGGPAPPPPPPATEEPQKPHVEEEKK